MWSSGLFTPEQLVPLATYFGVYKLIASCSLLAIIVLCGFSVPTSEEKVF